MSLGKLKRTLQREFMRNPAKSCTLLALLPVAGYFIGPLVWKQLPVAKGGATSPLALVAVVENGTTAGVTGPQPLPRWQEVAEWIEQDSRMKPSMAIGLRDPFRPVSKPADPNRESESERQKKQQLASAASLRPEDCGLELTATIVGPAKRLATINGRLYPENARVPFARANTSPAEPPPDDQAFVLKSVAKNYVDLERHGESFRLPIVRGGEK